MSFTSSLTSEDAADTQVEYNSAKLQLRRGRGGREMAFYSETAEAKSSVGNQEQVLTILSLHLLPQVSLHTVV